MRLNFWVFKYFSKYFFGDGIWYLKYQILFSFLSITIIIHA